MTDVSIELRGAVARREIVAWFQPQLDLANGMLVAAETLARWTHPTLGAVEPSLFIALAEELGLIGGIGQFMLEQGLSAAVEWSQRAHPVEVSVNVSPAQLITSRFTDDLGVEFQRLGLAPQSITVEITESLRIDDLPVVVRRLDELRALGIGVSLDDFGIGHASMTQLRRLHATELKIDRSLVADDSDRSTDLLTAVIAEVHDAGLLVVAEGVETEAQLARVRELGCDRAQGYLIARPMPRAELRELLGSQR